MRPVLSIHLPRPFESTYQEHPGALAVALFFTIPLATFPVKHLALAPVVLSLISIGAWAVVPVPIVYLVLYSVKTVPKVAASLLHAAAP